MWGTTKKKNEALWKNNLTTTFNKKKINKN